MEQGNDAHRITWLENRMTAMEERMEKVDEIHDIVTRVRGGWSTLAVIGTIGLGVAIVMNAVTGFLSWLKH